MPKGESVIKTFYKLKEAASACTCRTPPETLPDRPPSRAFFVAKHGRCLLLDSIGPAIDNEIETVGSENLFEGVDDGIWIWSGTFHVWRCYDGDYDSELRGDFVEATKEQWVAWVEHEESPWDEEYEDYYKPGPPCPVHGKEEQR